MTKEYMNITEIAEYLGCSVRTIGRKMTRGMPYGRVGRNGPLRFRAADVDRWISECGRKEIVGPEELKTFQLDKPKKKRKKNWPKLELTHGIGYD